MSELSSEIRAIIKRIAQENVPMQTTLCRVISVDSTSGKESIEADPLNDDANFKETRLRASLNGATAGIVVYPKVGTEVIVGILDNNLSSAFVIQVNEPEQIKITTTQGIKFNLLTSGTVEVDAPKIVLRKGILLGIPSVIPLVSMLNRLEVAFNAFMAAYNTHVHATPGTAPSTPPTAIANPPFPGIIAPLTTVSTIENPNITQG